MDPLSVAASIVGILAAAGKISELLHTVVISAKEAPQIVTALMFEVDDVRSAFASLQSLLVDLSSAPPRRTAMVQVDRLIVTLTETVLTFSELETVVTPLVVSKGQKYPLRTRLKWTRVEQNCERMVAKLQRHKSSVSLMLNVLQCTSDAEAARSQASLEILVEQLLQTNRGLCKRMRNLEDTFDVRTIRTNSQSDALSLMSHGDTATITSVRRKRNRISMLEPFRIRFAFDDDLESSRVYSRVMLEDSCDRSFNSSAVRTNAWSVFSGLSLADISVVSVVALPIYASDIRNQEHYLFGDVQAMQPFKKTGRENSIASAQTISGPPSLFSCPVTLKDASVKEQLSGIIYAEQMLEDDGNTRKVIHNNLTEQEFLLRLKNSFTPLREPIARTPVRGSPCPICSGGYLEEGQILDLAGTERHDGCRICSECGEPLEWIAQVVLGKCSMPALICTICIGNLSTATMVAMKTINETDNEPVIEYIVEPIINLAIDPTNESVKEEGTWPEADSQSYRRRTWDGSSHNTRGRKKTQIKRTLDDLEIVNRSANMESNRSLIDNDYNVWHNEKLPIVQTRKEKVKTIPRSQEYLETDLAIEEAYAQAYSEMDLAIEEAYEQVCSEMDLAIDLAYAQANLEMDLKIDEAYAQEYSEMDLAVEEVYMQESTRDDSEVDMLVAEEIAQGTIEEHLEMGMGMSSTEQHATRALSLFDFPFGREERAKNMLGRQDISEMELPLTGHAARALSV